MHRPRPANQAGIEGESAVGLVKSGTGARGVCVKPKSFELVAEDALVLADAGAGVGAPVRLGVESRSTEEVVLDELHRGSRTR